MSTRVPRPLARRREAARPADPALALLHAYGVTDPVPETTTMTWTREGITLDVFARGQDGDFLLHHDPHGYAAEPVTVTHFYPHPTHHRRIPR